MHRISKPSLKQFAAVAAILSVGAWASSVQAQATLRWKLSAGDRLIVAITQDTTSQVAYSGKSTTTRITISLQLAWEVVSAEDDAIRIKQTLQTLTIGMASPAGRVDYDSAATARPTGRARELATAIAPLLGSAVEITMSRRGEIVAVKPANESAEKMLAPTDDPMKDTPLAKTTIEQLLKQPLAVLPENAVAAGDEWTTSTELNSALGKAQQTTTYRYVGPAEADGMKADKIESKATLKLDAANAASKLTLKQHEQTGTILFSTEAGRVVRAEQHQKLITERPYRETTIIVSLESKQTTVISPAPKE
jgi:hypothetical protein